VRFYSIRAAEFAAQPEVVLLLQLAGSAGLRSLFFKKLSVGTFVARISGAEGGEQLSAVFVGGALGAAEKFPGRNCRAE
jgi:hypothetical protein